MELTKKRSRIKQQKGMDIIVCLKRVPEAGARIEIEKDGLEIKSDQWILNPYDEFAVEEAIRIKERFGAMVTLINASAEGAEEILKRGIAMGADCAVYIKGPALKGLNGLNIARVLATVISDMPFDLILCGKQATDDDSGVVGGAIAGLLHIPFVSAVKKLNIFPEERQAESIHEVEVGTEIVECRLPALFTTHKGLNEPRYPTLQGIMRAKKEGIKYINLDSPDLKPGDFLKDNLKRVGLSCPQRARKGKTLKGDVRGQAIEAVKFLKDEVKVL